MIVKVLQIMHLSKGCVRRPVAAIANDSFQVIGEYEDASGPPANIPLLMYSLYVKKYWVDNLGS